MKVYIAAAKRTAIGGFLGSLKSTGAAHIASEVLKNIIAETGVSPENIDEVITGNVLSGGLGQCVSRQAAINAGVPETVPAYAVNMVCGSGMKAVINAYLSIQAGVAGLVAAGGTENMSMSPLLMPHTIRTGTKMGALTMTDTMIVDGLTDAFSGVHMGITAENIAERYGITRERQDEFAYASQQKAIAAVDSGKFKSEIVPIAVKDGKNEFVFDTDEYPNRTSNPEKLASLRAAFKDGGTVTAGNSSGINDGAAYLFVASETALRKYNLKPLVEIIGIGQGGVNPQTMGLGPIPAVRRALREAGYSLSDMDVVELNEAFAAQSLGVVQVLCEEHKMKEAALLEKTNVNGGAIALGHPIGASGARIIVSLVHEMLRSKKKLGLASLCIGGGMGTAVVLRSV